jgi:hypothetical protein
MLTAAATDPALSSRHSPTLCPTISRRSSTSRRLNFAFCVPVIFSSFDLFDLANSWLELGNKRFEALKEIDVVFENVVFHFGPD